MLENDGWLQWLRRRRLERRLIHWFASQPLPPIAFSDVTVSATPPSGAPIHANMFFEVVHRGKSRWVIFVCPCGCGSVITLSLQRSHAPRWVLEKTANNRPSLLPSVWRTTGCQSHFWVHDGRVYWCGSDEPSHDIQDANDE